LRRSRAQAGDYIYVTGTLGDAGLGLCMVGVQSAEGEPDPYVTGRLMRPEPRVAEGIILRTLARAAIDISDGLLADLHHILDSSGVGAVLQVDQVPRSSAFDKLLRSTFPDKPALRDDLPLVAGDDYELCFTVPPENRDAVEQQLAGLSGCTAIGVITAEPGLHCQRDGGMDYQPSCEGYEHFRTAERRGRNE
jgi:thiamine-monophosphate kinase